MSTLRANDADLDATAEYLGVDPRLVQAALDYYGEFAEEVDADAAIAEQVAGTEQARWDRARQAVR
jgi:hypothetical protein